MKRMLTLLFWLAMISTAQAATETIMIDFLPLQEAADLARSQLSTSGKVATLPSRRLLILEDDQAHLEKARKLIEQLDRMPEQFTTHVDIEAIANATHHRAGVSGTYIETGKLPGGWIQVRLQQQNFRTTSKQAFQLRVSAGEPGNLEIGQIQPVRQEIRQWLSGYGLIRQESVELVTLTSGFHIQLWPTSGDKVRLRITPWMQQHQPQLQGQQEILVDLGSTNAPATAPDNRAPMRLNAVPSLKERNVVEITGASTELTVPTGKSVTIAAVSSEAGKLGSLLLSRHSSTEQRQFLIRLRIDK